MDLLILFSITFIIITIGRYILFIISKRRIKKNKLKPKDNISLEIQYLIKKFKIKRNKIDNKKITFIISLIDAFIISTTLILIMFISKNMIIQIPVGFVLAFILIYFSYEVFGKILIKRGYDKK